MVMMSSSPSLSMAKLLQLVWIGSFTTTTLAFVVPTISRSFSKNLGKSNILLTKKKQYRSNNGRPTTAIWDSSAEASSDDNTESFRKGRSYEDNNDIIDDNDDYDDDDNEEDWRTFRAKLVSLERGIDLNQNNGKQILSSSEIDISGASADGALGKQSSWAYESGSSIEDGTILLNQPPSSSSSSNDLTNSLDGFGLFRQYLHKAVILILDYDENLPTRGVILNRPTDLTIRDETINDEEDEDEEEEDHVWNVRYGGNEWGLASDQQKLFCLHSLRKSPQATEVSKEIMHGIYFTSFQHAQDLVKLGYAQTSDFWTFCGYVTWEIGELLEDVNDGVWHTVSTDSNTLKNGLRILNAASGIDVEDAGTRVWSRLMGMIGQNGPIHDNANNFNDSMLREWTKENLLFPEEQQMVENRDDDYDDDYNELDDYKSAGLIAPGTVIRGSSKGSPFLLEHQEFHQSLVLVLQDTEVSTGIILNHPSSKTADLSFLDKSSFFQNKFEVPIPLRFGGLFHSPEVEKEDDDGGDNVAYFFLHMNPLLCEKGIGEPVGENFPEGIWKIREEHAIRAIANRLADPEDFMVVEGFCIWPKGLDEQGNVVGGVLDEILDGRFEVVQEDLVEGVWKSLISQNLLSSKTLDSNLEKSKHAWEIAERTTEENVVKDWDFQLMFGSVSLLNDDALKRWVASYLLP